MKKTGIALVFSLALLTGTGCKDNDDKERADKKNEIPASEVSDVVKNAFTTRYPNAGEIIWEKAHEKDIETFKVKFKQDSVYMKAEFGKDGNFIKESKDD
jgi:hypothetical protein